MNLATVAGTQADDYYGEEVVAIVVPSAEVHAQELDDWVAERLAPYKLPRRYAFVSELPRGVSGKTLKRRLREQLAAGEILAESLARDRPTQ